MAAIAASAANTDTNRRAVFGCYGGHIDPARAAATANRLSENAA